MDCQNSGNTNPSPSKTPENPELLEQLIALGFDSETAHLAIQFASGNDVEIAVNWILENPQIIEELKMGATSSSGTVPQHWVQTSQPHKMIFVVNTSLKMGAGKMAAQVGHAAVALYRICQSTQQGQKALEQWAEHGEMKIVVKGEDTAQLEQLQKEAREAAVFSYLIADAGHTQIPAGSRTVLGIFGTHDDVNKITGNLKLF